MFKAGTTITFDFREMNKLAVQTAACVLVVCSERSAEQSVDSTASTLPADAVAQQLAPHYVWDTTDYTNALQTQVSFLYDFVQLVLDQSSGSLQAVIGQVDREIIAKALDVYQEWKTRLIAAEKRHHGKGWGDATGFNRADWSDLNGLFLEPQPA